MDECKPLGGGQLLQAGPEPQIVRTKFQRVWYDKVPEAINLRALAQKIQLKILESKDAISFIASGTLSITLGIILNACV